MTSIPTFKFATLCLLIVCAGCTMFNPAETTSNPAPEKSPPSMPGEFIVTARSVESISKWDSQYQIVTIDKEDKTYLFRRKKIGSDQDSFSTLSESADFVSVDRNFISKADEVVPRDPRFLELWGLRNFGQNSPRGVEGIENADIGATRAWEKAQGSSDVLVGIIDTGIDYNHPNLRDNIYVNLKEKNGTRGTDNDQNDYFDDIRGWNFVSENRTTLSHGQLGDPDAMDDNGHGTHVAGTIGAVPNGTGIVGINWKVKMMPLKFLSAAGSGSSADEIRAIRYATRMGVNIVNASYGGGGYSKAAEDALRKACAAHVLFVAAAGNDSANNDYDKHYPANYDLDCILSVAATNNRDQIATFSNYGYKTVGIAAPGVDILSTYPVALDFKEAAAGRNSGLRDPYRIFSGTSMATPHVVGAAALVAGAEPALKTDPVALKKRLMDTVDLRQQLATRVTSGGRLNVFRALKNESNVSTQLAGSWKEEAADIVTPRYANQTKIDQVWKVSKPGAKAIKLHVREGNLDTQFDVLVVFDSLHREIMRLPESMMDEWLPAVAGDTLYVKFSNAVVSQTKTNTKIFNTLEEVDWTVYRYCQNKAGKYECAQGSFADSIFANITSEGYQFDKFSYLESGDKEEGNSI